ncbi:MAG: hypothetical protein QM223_02520 [Bacteroidota bacterium]|jgi:hypothetical protein|nr:hypothetical protein [Bacteroidota bacterium]HHU01397.1 hypothetical protein [Bacteroidales bacterium]
MKTLMITLAMFFFMNVVKGQGFTTDFAVTDNDTIFCKTLTVGHKYVTCKKDDGAKIKIKKVDLLKYACDGRLWEKMPVIDETTGKVQYAMLEMIAYKNGTAIYKENRYSLKEDNYQAWYHHYNVNDNMISQKLTQR